MKRVMINCVIAITVLTFLPVQNSTADTNGDDNSPSDTIIAMEKKALTRWNNGDPSGYLDIYADEITYFDEDSRVRLDGINSLKKLFAPLKGKIYSDHFELLNPKVQLHDNTGILTYNVVTYTDGKITSRWNSTEVYSKINGAWKIIHSHWSYTKHDKPKK